MRLTVFFLSPPVNKVVGRYCFHRCLSVCPQGGRVSLVLCSFQGQDISGPISPSGGIPYPPGYPTPRYPTPRMPYPPGYPTLRYSTLLDTPPPLDTLPPPSTKMGGTHPFGMLSCLTNVSTSSFRDILYFGNGLRLMWFKQTVVNLVWKNIFCGLVAQNTRAQTQNNAGTLLATFGYHQQPLIQIQLI